MTLTSAWAWWATQIAGSCIQGTLSMWYSLSSFISFRIVWRRRLRRRMNKVRVNRLAMSWISKKSWNAANATTQAIASANPPKSNFKSRWSAPLMVESSRKMQSLIVTRLRSSSALCVSWYNLNSNCWILRILLNMKKTAKGRRCVISWSACSKIAIQHSSTSPCVLSRSSTTKKFLRSHWGSDCRLLTFCSSNSRRKG